MYASGKREHGDDYCKQITSFLLFSSIKAKSRIRCRGWGFLVETPVVDRSWEVCWRLERCQDTQEKKNKNLGLMFWKRCRRSPGPGCFDPGSGRGGTGTSGHSWEVKTKVIRLLQQKVCRWKRCLTILNA